MLGATHMIDLEKIKAIPIEAVATSLGFQISRGSARCRLPGHDDKTPSFSIRTKTNSFKCFACNQSGDTITLVRLMQGVDFASACDWINNRFGLNAITTSKTTKRRPPRQPIIKPAAKIAASAASSSEFDIDMEIFEWVMAQSPLLDSGREYLASRGFSPETVAYFNVGQMKDDRTILKNAREHFGDERLKRCGLMSVSRRGPYFAFRSNYLLFPYVEEGAVVFIQARRPDSGEKFRWVCPHQLPPTVFNLDVLSSAASTITICEGVTDVLSAHELKIAALGLVGASAKLNDKTIARLKGRNVTLLGDADKAGNDFSKRLTKLLSERGITAVSKTLPNGFNDLNDYLRHSRGTNGRA